MMFEEKNQPDHLLSMTSLGYALSVKLWDKIKKNHLGENVQADLSVSHQFFFLFSRNGSIYLLLKQFTCCMLFGTIHTGKQNFTLNI